MTKSVKNAFIATAVLFAVTAVCVAVLTVCNMFFPKYKPMLDLATCKIINAVCPTGQTDSVALKDGYIVMLDCGGMDISLEGYNKDNRSVKAEILAVYGLPKTDGTPFVIESRSAGRDGDVVILTAYKNGEVFGATVKKQSDGYWNKLPSDIFDRVKGTTGDVDLAKQDGLAKTGATISLTAVSRSVTIANRFAAKYSVKIDKELKKLAGGGNA